MHARPVNIVAISCGEQTVERHRRAAAREHDGATPALRDRVTRDLQDSRRSRVAQFIERGEAPHV